MAYVDDVREQRRAWAAEDSHQAAARPDTPATNGVRSKSTWMIAIGLPCLFPPLTPFGVFLVVAGGLLLLCSPTIGQAEQAAHQATVEQVAEGTGNGCGAVVWACVVATVIVIGVVMAALVAAQGMRP